MENKPSDGNSWRVVGLLGAVGADIAICMFVGYAVGRYFDRLQGGTIWTIIGVVAGFLLGLTSIILIIKRYLEGSDG